MIKALLLVFEPQRTWDRIAAAQRSVGSILVIFLLPLLVLTSVVDGYGLTRWGERQEDGVYIKVFAVPQAVAYEIGQGLLTLGAVFLGAKLVKALGETFHGRHTFTQSFAVVAYGLSPMISLRILDAHSAVNPWVTWIIGALLVMGVLYQGVPRVMLPDPPHAFGLYLMSGVLIVLITGLARFVTAFYLKGRFKPLENFVNDLTTRLTP